MKKLVQIPLMVSDTAADTICKMLLGYCLNMDKMDKNYHAKLASSVEFIEQAIPPFAPAVAMYYKLIDLMPATWTYTVPEPIKEYTLRVIEEVETAYGGPLPDKYKSTIKVAAVEILGADGRPVTTGKTLQLV